MAAKTTKGKKKSKGGRPRKLRAKDIEATFDAYLKENPEKPTISGLCLALNVDRGTLVAWAHEKPENEYSRIARRILTQIADAHERNLYDAKGGAANGSIFWLRCHKWQDSKPATTKVESSSSGGESHLKIEIVAAEGVDPAVVNV